MHVFQFAALHPFSVLLNNVWRAERTFLFMNVVVEKFDINY